MFNVSVVYLAYKLLMVIYYLISLSITLRLQVTKKSLKTIFNQAFQVICLFSISTTHVKQVSKITKAKNKTKHKCLKIKYVFCSFY
jgi:hypothetical protein